VNVRVDALGGATSLADRKRRAGQRLVLGFDTPWLTDDQRRLVAEVRPAGFLFRRRNCVEPAQITGLIRELQGLGDPHDPPLFGVDQEGGRVLAVGAPATEWPSMRAVALAEADPGAVGRALGTEMRSLGFHLVFGPVADVDRGATAIGDRSFGGDPQRVASLVAGFVDGLHAAGVIACVKHFPGHGAADGDSHQRLPVAERDGRELRAVDLVPFRAAVARGVGCVMTAHVLFPEWDESWPASLSTRVVDTVLRRELGFRGVVVTDDLDMSAVRGFAHAELAERITAGAADLAMITDDVDRQHGLYTELIRAQELHPRHDRAAARSVRRLDALRVRFLRATIAPQPVTVLGTVAHRRLAAEVAERGKQ
jgi:beta-N-acetylhexosaminidase